jgi:hypothetical protein
MTRTQGQYLDELLSPRGTLVQDDAERQRLAEGVVTEDSVAEPLRNYVTGHVRVAAARLTTGETVVRVDDVDDAGFEDDEGVEFVNRHVYLCHGSDEQAVDEARRLLLAETLDTQAMRRFAGWRDRVVALIRDLWGEYKIVRTLADGAIEMDHGYSVLDGVTIYANWVRELAQELRDVRVGDPADFAIFNLVVHPWLVKEAAEAELEQARFSLRYGIGGITRSGRIGTSADGAITISELARGLYTDRANLSRLVSSAEKQFKADYDRIAKQSEARR